MEYPIALVLARERLTELRERRSETSPQSWAAGSSFLYINKSIGSYWTIRQGRHTCKPLLAPSQSHSLHCSAAQKVLIILLQFHYYYFKLTCFLLTSDCFLVIQICLVHRIPQHKGLICFKFHQEEWQLYYLMIASIGIYITF